MVAATPWCSDAAARGGGAALPAAGLRAARAAPGGVQTRRHANDTKTRRHEGEIVQLGMIGLGRMGGNMVRRLMRAGHECVVYASRQTTVQGMVSEGAVGSTSIAELVSKLSRPRAAWVMVPSGDVTDDVVRELAKHLEPGDIVIDGGNSYFKDDVRRSKELSPKGIQYVDCGTSGGIWGIDRGYCLMIGGPEQAVKHLDPIFRTLAPGPGNIDRTPGREHIGGTAEDGYLHCGPVGAGHFVKMIHNGIEYGLMQAYAEGFDIMRGAQSEKLPEDIRYELPLRDISELWRRGSVVASWLLDLTAIALAGDPKLESFSGFVQDSGEGRWTVMTAVEEAVPAEVLSSALYTRFRSRQEHTFAEKVLSAMRKGFGGHAETPSGH
jgi:6-phosphogluconate dehydrogenase